MSRLYATTTEFTNHPTGLNVSNLINGADADLQTEEMQQVLQYASSFCDTFCVQPLFARSVVDTQRRRPNAFSEVVIPLRYFPVQSLTSIESLGYPGGVWSTVDPNNTVLANYDDLMPGTVTIGSVYSGAFTPPVAYKSTYIAGYCNCLLTAGASMGATTVSVDSVVGLAVGDEMMFYDVSSTGGIESLVVDSLDATANTITFTSPTTYAHGVGIRVSALPGAVSIATIEIAAVIIKQRRAGGGVTMAGELQSSGVQSDEMQIANLYLKPYRRVV